MTPFIFGGRGGVDLNLDCDRCVIRSWRRRDRIALARHGDDPEVGRTLRDRFPQPYTLEDADAWIGFCLARDPQTDFTIEVDGEASGGIGVVLQEDIHRRSAEIGFWLGRSVWDRGVASAAVAGFSDWAMGAFALVRLYAFVLETNPASVRVLEKCGYRCEGRLQASALKEGRLLDQFLYAKVESGKPT